MRHNNNNDDDDQHSLERIGSEAENEYYRNIRARKLYVRYVPTYQNVNNGRLVFNYVSHIIYDPYGMTEMKICINETKMRRYVCSTKIKKMKEKRKIK